MDNRNRLLMLLNSGLSYYGFYFVRLSVQIFKRTCPYNSGCILSCFCYYLRHCLIWQSVWLELARLELYTRYDTREGTCGVERNL